jgi:probable O-glycosylation ligase (exosortase A-associated)
MNPHRLTYGAAYDFPFAAVVTAVTLISLLFTKQQRRFPVTPVTVMLIVFMMWTTLTSFFALEPGLVWQEWSRVMKTMLMVLVAMITLRTEKDIKLLAWTIGLSLGFYGLKGGVFTIASGGSSHVFGPEGSYITDNNALALALITALPIIWYLQLHTERRWLRIGLTGLVLFTIVAAAGSYSRGALLGGGAMLSFLWLKSRYKLRAGVALLLIVPLVYLVMPEKWFGRMETIDNYSADASVLGRFNAWHFAANVAKDNVMGGGFNVFSRKMFLIYAPEPLNHHAAHSIYFQVLGEHGFVGLALYLILMLLAWRTGTRIIKFCKGKAELKWASDLAAMCQVSFLGFAVGGSFLSLAYYDLYYYIIVLLVSLEKLLLLKSDKAVRLTSPMSALSPRSPTNSGEKA